MFFFSDFLEIQRKSFYLFLNKKLGEEFSKIQPLHNSRKWYKNSQGLSTKENLPNLSLQTKNWISNELLNQNRNAIDFSYFRPRIGMANYPGVPAGFDGQGDVHSQKIATTKTKDRIITIDFLYRNYKFIQPTLSIEESILFSKTYCCHFYFPVRLFDYLTNLVEIRWIFLGTLPLLTRRGHFIINGTPRVILNQIVRSPGIYFQKERTEIKQNSRLFYAEIISKSGPWIRIEIDSKKKLWIVFQQNRISLSYFFQNFDQKFMDHQLFLYEKKKKLNFSATLANKFFWKELSIQDLHKNNGCFDQSCVEPSGRQKISLVTDETVPYFNFKNRYEVLRKYLKFHCAITKPTGAAEKWSSYHQLSPSFINLNFQKNAASKLNSPNIRLNFFPEKSGSQFTKSKQTFSTILFASSAKESDLGLNLGRTGRSRLNKRLGLCLQTLTLTPMDCFAISDILYQLAKNIDHNSPSDAPEVMADKVRADDIDDLKNRRLKTIGELLQNQLGRGLLRLQKIFENTLQKDWIKLNQTNSSNLSFLNSLNFERKKNVLHHFAYSIRSSSNSNLNPILDALKEKNEPNMEIDVSDPPIDLVHSQQHSKFTQHKAYYSEKLKLDRPLKKSSFPRRKESTTPWTPQFKDLCL